ncbi:MAG: hypothetical protein H7A21_18860 [Spirochaetales bacterium]|nr:hypothetical protein [Leptospiraceae bacterium]MCP5483505.1 hypothetical protein [Spirochaetales bacterium]MCP5486743.1 hypothetical protein [Spirochaetales bacterium]
MHASEAEWSVTVQGRFSRMLMVPVGAVALCMLVLTFLLVWLPGEWVARLPVPVFLLFGAISVLVGCAVFIWSLRAKPGRLYYEDGELVLDLARRESFLSAFYPRRYLPLLGLKIEVIPDPSNPVAMRLTAEHTDNDYWTVATSETRVPSKPDIWLDAGDFERLRAMLEAVVPAFEKRREAAAEKIRISPGEFNKSIRLATQSQASLFSGVKSGELVLGENDITYHVADEEDRTLTLPLKSAVPKRVFGASGRKRMSFRGPGVELVDGGGRSLHVLTNDSRRRWLGKAERRDGYDCSLSNNDHDLFFRWLAHAAVLHAGFLLSTDMSFEIEDIEIAGPAAADA